MTTRSHCILAVFLLIAAGLLTRHFAANLSMVGEYAPDAMWAMMVYFLLAFITPGAAHWKIGLCGLLFAYGIEFSQLYHAAWIDHLRSYRIGGLVLGYGFLWSDLICYTAGIIVAMVIEVLLREWLTRTSLDTPQ